MTLASSLALLSAMIVLAVLPGPGILVVTARSSKGFSHGFFTSMGIVCGDYCFIALSLSGLALIAHSYSELFKFVQYLGAAYLFWLGINLFRNRNNRPSKVVTQTKLGYIGDYSAGLLTTLSNPKALMFYGSFFPSFVDFTALNINDIAIILFITTLAVGGVMLVYAYLATALNTRLLSQKSNSVMSCCASASMIAAAFWLVLRGD